MSSFCRFSVDESSKSSENTETWSTKTSLFIGVIYLVALLWTKFVLYWVTLAQLLHNRVINRIGSVNQLWTWLYYGSITFASNPVTESAQFFKKNFGRPKFFLWVHWYPYSGLLVMSPLGFKARVGSLIHTWQRYMCYMFPLVPLVWYLPTSLWPAFYVVLVYSTLEYYWCCRYKASLLSAAAWLLSIEVKQFEIEVA